MVMVEVVVRSTCDSDDCGGGGGDDDDGGDNKGAHNDSARLN